MCAHKVCVVPVCFLSSIYVCVLPGSEDVSYLPEEYRCCNSLDTGGCFDLDPPGCREGAPPFNILTDATNAGDELVPLFQDADEKDEKPADNVHQCLRSNNHFIGHEAP